MNIPRLIAIVLSAIVLLSISSSVVNIIGYHNSQVNCNEIEQIKGRVRENAIDSYKKLDQNAKLLGIKVTPKLRKAEKNAELKTLSDYAPTRCAGFFGG